MGFFVFFLIKPGKRESGKIDFSELIIQSKKIAGMVDAIL